ncbi:MAG TPA: ribose-phosphate pyrophosphokinase [Gemmatimonadales bacterium]|nr:ribose-phosphate pyrophosphokinase [Gemmatimonadales bacterium]
MTGVVLSFPGNERLGARLGAGLGLEVGAIELHRFPDGEARVQLSLPVGGRPVILAATLDRPDEKLLPVLFAAATAHDLGAASVGLVAPYLAYLRQDRRFAAGQGISARYFARLLSEAVDWLTTVDPHLHRISKLEEVYSVPVKVVHTAARMADWVRTHIARPMIIGPDAESAQWVSVLAGRIGAPHAVLSKRRVGDRTVDIRLPDLNACVGRQPVLVDDIVSSGATMLEAIRLLREGGWPAAACLAVHGVFAGDAYQRLLNAGAAMVVTCNTIPHPSNGIDVIDLLVDAVTHLQRPEPSLPSLGAVW